MGGEVYRRYPSMLSAADMDEYDLWLPEIVENDGRPGRCGGPRPRPSNEINTVRISRSIILAELLKKLGGSEACYDITCRDDRYFCYVCSSLPGVAGSSSLQEISVNSVYFYSDVNDAKEKAANNLIGALKGKFGFEVDDVNWLDKNQFQRDTCDNFCELRRAMEENETLKEKVELLISGWQQTLNRLANVCELSSATRSSAFDSYILGGDDGGSTHAVADAVQLEDAVKTTWIEGLDLLDRVKNVA